MFRDLGITLLAQAAVAFGGLLLYRLIARELGTRPSRSSRSSSRRRRCSSPLVTVGLVEGCHATWPFPGGLTGRYPKRTSARPSRFPGRPPRRPAHRAERAGPHGRALLRVSERSHLVPAFAGLLAATSIFYIAYGWFRGLLRLRLGRRAPGARPARYPSHWSSSLFPDEDVATLVLVMAAGPRCPVAAVRARPADTSTGRARTRRRPGASCGATDTAAFPASSRSSRCSPSSRSWPRTWRRSGTWPT